MTGLLGGGHAIYWDAATGRARLLDCFCAVPSGHGGELLELQVPFGEELVHYAVGAASCAVPGVPAGLDALWREHGRLPWADLCAPALRLARDGVEMPPAHVACLEMLEPVMTMREGARIYAPEGRLLLPGELLEQPGLVRALEAHRRRRRSKRLRGVDRRVAARTDRRTWRRRHARRPRWVQAILGGAGRGRRTRARASSRAAACPASSGTLAAPAAARRRAGSARCSCSTRSTPSAGRRRTQRNLVTTDADGNACVLTTSLGLGSGDWLPGLDLHLNSMLGEIDLLVGELEPGERMQSMMAPSVALDGDGPRRSRSAPRAVLGSAPRSSQWRRRSSTRASSRRRPSTVRASTARATRQRRAWSRRGCARRARAARARRPPLARPPPLLRRRQPRFHRRPRRRPAAQRQRPPLV